MLTSPKSPKTKILGIGHGRTGTTSLTMALRLMGYSVVHFPTTLQEIDDHEAANSIPVNVWALERLAKRYPDTKVIYTIRSVEPWLDSHEKVNAKSFESKRPSVHDRKALVYWQFVEYARLSAFGQVEFDRKAWEEAYWNHHESVKAFAAETQTDILMLNVCEGKSENVWASLGLFLGAETPIDKPFPHELQR